MVRISTSALPKGINSKPPAAFLHPAKKDKAPVLRAKTLLKTVFINSFFIAGLICVTTLNTFIGHILLIRRNVQVSLFFN
mmetsp:Transcript_12024/g.21560  ORF Transcript_12024/g.21560 Transcript_12024/m.21560 type:complete len:80 (+) Transcript_12024:131-370(+)